jgi:hypothetical protein
MKTRQLPNGQAIHLDDSDFSGAVDALLNQRMDSMKMRLPRGKKRQQEEMDMDDMDKDEMEDREDSVSVDEWNDLVELANLQAEQLSELQERTDAAEASVEILQTAIALREDSDDDDDEVSPDELEAWVANNIDELMQTDAAREYLDGHMDSVLETMQQARNFLPNDFEVKGSSSPHSIKVAALQGHYDSDEVNFDDPAEVNGAFKGLLKLGSSPRRQDSDPAARLVSRRDGGGMGFGHKGMDVPRPVKRSRPSDF